MSKVDLLKEIKDWSKVYEFSFQFWGEGNNNVFIEKGGIELASFGGFKSVDDAFKATLKWIYKVNPHVKNKLIDAIKTTDIKYTEDDLINAMLHVGKLGAEFKTRVTPKEYIEYINRK